MKVREWARAAEPLHDALPGFRPMRLGFVHEDEWLAKGVYADSSSFRRDRFSLSAFVLPLFVPTEHLNLSYGFRIGGQWERVDEVLVRAVVGAVPRLDALATLRGLADLAHNWRVNVRHAELQLCIAVLGRDELAFSQFARLMAGWCVNHDWEAEVIDRSTAVVVAQQTRGWAAAEDALAARRGGVLEVLA